MGKEHEQQKRYDDNTHQTAVTVTAIDIYIRMAERLFRELFISAYQQEAKEHTEVIAKNRELWQTLHADNIVDELPTYHSDSPPLDSAFTHFDIYDVLIPDDNGTSGLLPLCLRPYLFTLLEQFLNAQADGKALFSEDQKNYWWKRLAGAPKQKQLLALRTAGVNLHALLVPPTANEAYWSIRRDEAMRQEREVRCQMLKHFEITDWDKVTRQIRRQDAQGKEALYQDARILPLLDCFILVVEVLRERQQLAGLYTLMQIMYFEDTGICHTRDRHAIVALACPFDGLMLSVGKKDLRKQLRHQFVFDTLKKSLNLTTPALDENTSLFDTAFQAIFLPWISKNEMPNPILSKLIPKGQTLALELKHHVDQEFIRIFNHPDEDNFYEEEALLGMKCHFSPLLTELQRWFKRHAKFYYARRDGWQGSNDSRQTLALTVISWLKDTFRPSDTLHNSAMASSSHAPPLAILSMKEAFYLISRVFDAFTRLDALETSYFSVLLAHDDRERQLYIEAKQFFDTLLTKQNLIARLHSPQAYQDLGTHVTTLENFHIRMHTEGLEAFLSSILTAWKQAGEEADLHDTFRQRSQLLMAMAKLVYNDKQQQDPGQWVLFLTDERIQYYNEANRDGEMTYEATVSWITRVILVALNRAPNTWTPIFYTEVQKVKTAIESGFYQPELDAKQTALKQETREHAYPAQLITQLDWAISQYEGPKDVLIDMSDKATSSSLPEAVTRSQSGLVPKKTERPPLYLLTPQLFTTKDSFLLVSYFCYYQEHDASLMHWLLDPARGFNPNGRCPEEYKNFFRAHSTSLALAQASNKAALISHLELLGANTKCNTPLHLAALGQLAIEDMQAYGWHYIHEYNADNMMPLDAAIMSSNFLFIDHYLQMMPNESIFIHVNTYINDRIRKNRFGDFTVSEAFERLILSGRLNTQEINNLIRNIIEESYKISTRYGYNYGYDCTKKYIIPFINLLINASKKFNLDITHPTMILANFIEKINIFIFHDIFNCYFSDDLINCQDDQGNNVLHLLILGRIHKEYFDKLTDNDLHQLFNVPNNNEKTPLHLLAEARYYPHLNYLFFKLCYFLNNKNINLINTLNETERETLLSSVIRDYDAVPRCDVDQINAFIQNLFFDKNLTHFDIRRVTPPLYFAIKYKQWDLVNKLWHDDFILLQDREGNTLLHLLISACASKQYFDKLTDAHLNNLFNIRNREGYTPLHLLFTGRNKLFRYLFCKFFFFQLCDLPDVDLSLPDPQGNTLLHLLINARAPKKYFDKLTDVHLNSLVNIRNREGYTPLHLLIIKLSTMQKESATSLSHLFYRLCYLSDIDLSLKVEPTIIHASNEDTHAKDITHTLHFQNYRAIDIILFIEMNHSIERKSMICFLYTLIYVMFLHEIKIIDKNIPFIDEDTYIKNEFDFLSTLSTLSKKDVFLDRKNFKINAMIQYKICYLPEPSGEEINDIFEMTLFGFMLTINRFTHMTSILRLLLITGAEADAITRVTEKDEIIRQNLTDYCNSLIFESDARLESPWPQLSPRFATAIPLAKISYDLLIPAIADKRFIESGLLKSLCQLSWLNPDVAFYDVQNKYHATPLILALLEKHIANEIIMMLAQRTSVAWMNKYGASALLLVYLHRYDIFHALFNLALMQKMDHPDSGEEDKALILEVKAYLDEVTLSPEPLYPQALYKSKKVKRYGALLLLSLLLTDKINLRSVITQLNRDQITQNALKDSHLGMLCNKVSIHLGHPIFSTNVFENSFMLYSAGKIEYTAITSSHLVTSPFYTQTLADVSTPVTMASSSSMSPSSSSSSLFWRSTSPITCDSCTNDNSRNIGSSGAASSTPVVREPQEVSEQQAISGPISCALF